MDDVDLRELEAQRLRSEIARNEAERDSLLSQRKYWWRPTLLAVGIVATMVASFAGFFSDLYQIAVADRDSVKKTNEGLVKEVIDAREQARLAALSVAAERSLVPQTSQPRHLKESDLYSAVLLTRWGPEMVEAHAVVLSNARDGLPGRGGLLAHGSQLGAQKTTSPLALAPGVEWSGNWKLTDGKLEMTELMPRMSQGHVIEVDIATWASGVRLRAKRTNGKVVENGVAELTLLARRE
jgi:hypothetical protein